MKIMSIIYSPSSCSKPQFFQLLNTKGDIWKMLVNKQLTVAIDFQRREQNTREVNGYRQLFVY